MWSDWDRDYRLFLLFFRHPLPFPFPPHPVTLSPSQSVSVSLFGSLEVGKSIINNS